MSLPKTPEPPRPVDRRDWLIAAALAGVTFAAFLPALRGGFVNLDDPYYVTNNRHVSDGLSLDGTRWALTAMHPFYWHPLTWLSLQLDATLFGTSPWGYHLTSVLFHAANAGLLFLALRALTGACWRSAAVALLFAVHPLRVESVAWVTERKDVLSAFFGFLALWAYAAYVRRPSAWRAFVPAGALALSLMAKPMLMTLPFLLLVLDWWPLGRWPGQGTWPLLREKLPLFAVIAGSVAVTALGRREIGVAADLQGLSAAGRACNAAVSYVAYLGKTAWPADLAVFYPHPLSAYKTATGLPAWKVAGAVLLLAAVTAGAVALRRRAPYLLAGWLWYVGTLAPVVGVVTQPGSHAYADRFTYFPQIGIFLAVSWGVADLVVSRAARVALAGGAAAALAAVTWNQSAVWHDSVTLWRHSLQVTGRNLTALMDLGDALAEQGQTAEAARYYREAQDIVPDFLDAHVNLGNVLYRSGKLDEAEREYRKALAVDPGAADLYCNLGLIDVARGDPGRAADRFREALRVRPDSAMAHSNLGNVLFSLGKLDEAEREQREAIRLADDPSAHHNLGSILFRQGKLDEAAREFEEVIRRSPAQYEAHLLLGEVESARNNLGRAADCYREALRLRPDSGSALDGLTDVLIKQGGAEKALPLVREALGRNPRDASAHHALGRLLEAGGDIPGAAREFGEAIRLGPNLTRAWYDLGRLFDRQGRRADAVTCFKRALEREPSSALFRKALDDAQRAQDRSGGISP